MVPSSPAATCIMWSRWRPIEFTVAGAKSALPYVARIVADAHRAYHNAQRCRAMIRYTPDPMRRCHLADELWRSLRALDEATDECNAIGIDLPDLSRGIVGFPSRLRGRAVTLIWWVGQPTSDRWCDLLLEEAACAVVH